MLLGVTVTLERTEVLFSEINNSPLQRDFGGVWPTAYENKRLLRGYFSESATVGKPMISKF